VPELSGNYSGLLWDRFSTIRMSHGTFWDKTGQAGTGAFVPFCPLGHFGTSRDLLYLCLYLFLLLNLDLGGGAGGGKDKTAIDWPVVLPGMRQEKKQSNLKACVNGGKDSYKFHVGFIRLADQFLDLAG
jgi:hypothetical protein